MNYILDLVLLGIIDVDRPPNTVVTASVSGPEFQLEIAAQSSSRIFVELDWAADRKLD